LRFDRVEESVTEFVADDISAFTRIDGSTSYVGMKKAEPNTIIKGVQSFPFV